MAVLSIRTPSGAIIRAVDASSPWRRLRGLLGRRELSPDEGCLIRPCSAVHMLGMRFAIDVVWLDADHRVVRVDARVPPGPHVRRCPGARAALELAAGAAERLGLTPGAAVAVMP